MVTSVQCFLNNCQLGGWRRALGDGGRTKSKQKKTIFFIVDPVDLNRAQLDIYM